VLILIYLKSMRSSLRSACANDRISRRIGAEDTLYFCLLVMVSPGLATQSTSVPLLEMVRIVLVPEIAQHKLASMRRILSEVVANCLVSLACACIVRGSSHSGMPGGLAGS